MKKSNFPNNTPLFPQFKESSAKLKAKESEPGTGLKQDKLRADIPNPGRYFGIIALEKGFINVNQLWEAILKQRGDHLPIGMILKDMGYLTQQQINEVLETIKKESKAKNSIPMA